MPFKLSKDLSGHAMLHYPYYCHEIQKFMITFYRIHAYIIEIETACINVVKAWHPLDN